MENQKQTQLGFDNLKTTAKKYSVYVFLAVLIAVGGFSLGNAKESPDQFVEKLSQWESEYSLSIKFEQQAQIARCQKENFGAGLKIQMNAIYPNRFVYSPDQISELMQKRDRDCNSSF